MQGTLKIKICKAKFSVNFGNTGQNTYYVVVSLGDRWKMTEQILGAHPYLIWNQELTFEVDGQERVELNIWSITRDEDYVDDDRIGTTAFSLEQFIDGGATEATLKTTEYALTGEIVVEIEFDCSNKDEIKKSRPDLFIAHC